MKREVLEAALEAALEDLYRSSQELTSNVVPYVPLPRPRVFRIAPGWTYPYEYNWEALADPRGKPEYMFFDSSRREVAAQLGEWVGWKPRAVLRVVRRLQAAAAWCRARAAGRKRAAEEILRQQRRAVEALEAEAAVRALGR